MAPAPQMVRDDADKSGTLSVMKKRLASGFALATLVTSTLIGQPHRFTLAIVRLDGGLVPFAAYDEGRWERAWPEADETADLAEVPSVWRRRAEHVPDVWHVWPASGGQLVEARVSGVEVVEAHCSSQIALKTNLTRNDAEHPRKIGVAADSPSVPVGAIEEVRRTDALWVEIERVVLASFSRVEASRASSSRAQLPRETPSPTAQITALYREAGSSRSPMYFVAEKKYRSARSPQDPKCTAVTIVTGWVVPTAAGAYVMRDARVFLTDCDGKEVRTAIPLASLRFPGRVFWILQEHGYEDETYLIAEIRQSDVLYPINVNGGGC